MEMSRFLALLPNVLGSKWKLNEEQKKCLEAEPGTPTFIVAGPGSGKTTVLVLRALRHVLVDHLFPEQIVITTFTKKAANEIQTRLRLWGRTLLAEASATATRRDQEFLRLVDVNRFVTGTLDSLCEEYLELSRLPSEPRYTLLDEFSARTLLARQGQLYQAAQEKPALKQYLANFTLDGSPPRTLGEAAAQLKPIADRVVHDLVDGKIYSDESVIGRHAALEVVQRYFTYLEQTAQVDFARLERVIRDRLLADRDVGALSEARAILVDEYQDTNLLQEQIYFQMVRRHKASFTVVGDDDQSLYRFRGATIELFRDFPSRVHQQLGYSGIKPIYLKRNYRSTPDIVCFFNDFIINDPDFSPGARVQPLKPGIVPQSRLDPFPVLGMFRDDPSTLASDVGEFLTTVFSADGYSVDAGKIVRADPKMGDWGDAVLLSRSVNEYAASWGDKPPKRRFPYYLRVFLEAQGIRVFNPRGRPLMAIPAVEELMGLLLEALDPSSATEPDGHLVSNMALKASVKRTFSSWRSSASNILAANPTALSGRCLVDQLAMLRTLALSSAGTPRDWPLIDAVYAFLPYIEVFCDDPEHQVYLETIARAAVQTVSFSRFQGKILSNEHNENSRKLIINDVLNPLAEGLIDVDEELIQEIPRNCFNMMTIHQAKGLEFPLVVVDVSSEFSGDYQKARFKRFPEQPSGAARLEDDLASHTSIGPLRLKRTGLQRSIEDLIRLYYVAYSRPQSVLLLVGNLKALRARTGIKHIGHFWRTDETWAWRNASAGGRGALASSIPLQLI